MFVARMGIGEEPRLENRKYLLVETYLAFAVAKTQHLAGPALLREKFLSLRFSDPPMSRVIALFWCRKKEVRWQGSRAFAPGILLHL